MPPEARRVLRYLVNTVLSVTPSLSEHNCLLTTTYVYVYVCVCVCVCVTARVCMCVCALLEQSQISAFNTAGCPCLCVGQGQACDCKAPKTHPPMASAYALTARTQENTTIYYKDMRCLTSSLSTRIMET